VAVGLGVMEPGLTFATGARAQVLETETARLRARGAVQAGINFEYQSSSEGHESAGVSYDNTHAILWRLGLTFRSE